MCNFLLFSGSSNLPLAQKLAKSLGVKLGKIDIDKLSNDEIRVRGRERVKEKTCYVLQSLSSPVHNNWAELLFIIDSLKRNGAKKIIVVMPWLGYQKQDRAFRDGEAVSVEVVIKTLEAVGMDQMITFDLHNPKIVKYFTKPVTVLSAFPLFQEQIRAFCHPERSRGISRECELKQVERLPRRPDVTSGLPRNDIVLGNNNYVLVAPDSGAYWVKEMAKKLGLNLATVDKFRNKQTGEVEDSLVLHGDVKGKIAIIVDDCVYSGQTLAFNAKLLKQNGAKEVHAFVTHAILSGDAPKLIQNSDLDSLTVSDTIFVIGKKMLQKLKIISIADLLSHH